MSNASAIRKCAECGQTAHTSTTCKNGKVGTINLFGVVVNPSGNQVDETHQLDDDEGGLLRKCKSMEVINLCNNENTSVDRGYHSDEHVGHGNGKKKGMSWTEEEHKLFLIGLENLGKGDWRGISKNYVKSRTPTQVASHAQKYFIRINGPQETVKRRSSLFDMPAHETIVAPVAPPAPIAPSAPIARPAPIAPPTNFMRPPVPRISRNYGGREYSYMPMVYPNNNENTSSNKHFSQQLSFIPVMNFPNHGCAYPYNPNWNHHFINRAPYATQPPLITQGEPKIIEVIDDDE